MNEEMRQRYNELKKKNEINVIRKELESNILLQECIEQIGGRVLDYDESQKIVINIQKKFQFTVNGRVDWRNFYNGN